MRFLLLPFLLTTLLAGQIAPAQQSSRDLFSDTWVAADALGRKLPLAGEARPARPSRFVGIFYFLWQGAHETTGPYDIGKLLAADAAHPAWGPAGAFHWWGEPQVGYFRADDPWVIRRNLTMLQNAGVDVLICDVTNAVTYPREVQALCAVAAQMRREGNRTPQIAFILHSNTAATVSKLDSEFYGKNLYPDLWFRWQGKPLILGDVNAKDADGSPITPALRDFFTWRDSWAWEAGQHKWPWIEKTPQRYGWDVDPNIAEEAPVAVASHPTLNIGRSFHAGAQPPPDAQGLTPTRSAGLYFAEQWKRLLEIDPQFAFIDGWNEWVAQRFVVQPGQQIEMAGRRLATGETFFVDAYNAEYSRDIEPMRGGYGDNYYFQMVAGIRRFKGVRPREKTSGATTIRLNGGLAQWNKVRPEYRDAIGDVEHREWPGWGNIRYTNTTGRNDIVTAKVACDARNVTFLVQTREPLTPCTDPNWMQLLIDADANAATGWNGYEYLINAPVIDATTTTLKRLSDGKTWKVAYRAAGNALQIVVPRRLIGQANRASVAFDFHWIDNCPVPCDIADFWTTGDSAPDGRFNYRYENTTDVLLKN